ncbi:unnamed protein product [Durusdinium trenchii]|uniref:Uncharacterized protein n=1 Tax=Durusdinium trenchii TaxID=1381693 RepID=A0ABP0MZP6_9DINO
MAVALPAATPKWRSVRPGKISWTEAEVESLAQAIRDHLPLNVASVLESDNYKGGDLIMLGSAIARPSAQELANNYVWLKPIIQASPTKVPSAYFVTDAFLTLDKKLGYKLFRPGPGEDRAYLAGREGVRAKKCVGALRYLWRNSTKAHDQRVQDMKSCLSPSPARAAEPEVDAEEAGAFLSDAAADDAPVADGDESADSDEAAAPMADAPMSEAEPGSSDSDVEVEKQQKVIEAEQGSTSGSDSGETPKTVEQSSSESETLRLPGRVDEEISDVSSESSDLHRDSQVSSGWMGKGINFAFHEHEKEKSREKHVESMLKELKADMAIHRGFDELKNRAVARLMADENVFEFYVEYCRSSLQRFGDVVYGQLADRGHYLEWILEKKRMLMNKRKEKGGSESEDDQLACQGDKDPKPLKRALSFMDLDGCPPDASWERAKCCKKPKLADAAVAAVSGDMRVVPPTVVKPAKKKTPCDGPRLDVFQGERLDDIPLEARPLQGVEYKGKKGYTVHGANGAAIEVLIFTKAYVVKKVGGRSSSATANHKTGQVTWTKFGGAGPAWAEAKARANF